MNDIIWPDFTKIPTVKNPKKAVLAYATLTEGKSVRIAGLQVKAIPMNHPVPAVGFLVSDGRSSFLYSADTGPNEGLWKEAARVKNLSAIIVDTSFPEQPRRHCRRKRSFYACATASRPDKSKSGIQRSHLYLSCKTGL